MKFLLIALLGITTAFAQSEPVTRIKGDNDASFKIAPNLKVPYKQATKINSTTARIETGNGNMLPDPSFESGVLPSNIIPTTAGEYAVACEGSGSRGIETNVLANDGTKVLKLMYGAGIGLGVGRCGIYYKVPDNLIGTNVEISFTGAVKYGSTICIRSVQSISPFASQDGNCLTTNDDIADKNKSFVFSITPVYDVVYLYFSKPDGDTATGTYRQAFLDTIHIGKPKSDEAIVAKFDNTTGWTPCTFSTLAWGALGTVTNNLDCQRDKGDLLMSGTFTTGTSSAGIVTMPLPTNYGNITHVYKQYKKLGIFINNENTQYHGGAILSYTSNLLAFTDRATFGSYTFKALEPTNNGSNVGAAGTQVSINIRIPIAEWSSQTNAAIVACKEGPLKCSNFFTMQVTSAGAKVAGTDGGLNWATITKGATGYYALNLLGGLTTAELNCMLTPTVDNRGMSITTASSTSFTVYSAIPNSALADTSFVITCTKGTTFNEAYDRIVIQKDNVGQTIDMRGPNCPAGTLPENGALVSTTEYSSLFNVIGYTYGGSAGFFRLPDSRGKANMGSISIPNATGTGTPVTNNATFTAHQFNRTGIRVRVVSGTLTGLATNTDYYTIYIDNNTLAFATTYANAIAGSKIAISGTNSVVIRQSVAASNTVAGNEIEDTLQDHEHLVFSMNNNANAQNNLGAVNNARTGSGVGDSEYRLYTTNGALATGGRTTIDTYNSTRKSDVTAPYHLVTTKCIKY